MNLKVFLLINIFKSLYNCKIENILESKYQLFSVEGIYRNVYDINCKFFKRDGLKQYYNKIGLNRYPSANELMILESYVSKQSYLLLYIVLFIGVNDNLLKNKEYQVSVNNLYYNFISKSQDIGTNVALYIDILKFNKFVNFEETKQFNESIYFNYIREQFENFMNQIKSIKKLNDKDYIIYKNLLNFNYTIEFESNFETKIKKKNIKCEKLSWIFYDFKCYKSRLFPNPEEEIKYYRDFYSNHNIFKNNYFNKNLKIRSLFLENYDLFPEHIETTYSEEIEIKESPYKWKIDYNKSKEDNTWNNTSLYSRPDNSISPYYDRRPSTHPSFRSDLRMFENSLPSNTQYGMRVNY